MTTAEILATWRTKAHGILYRFERSVEELAAYQGSEKAKRNLTHEWDLAWTRTIHGLEQQAELYQNDEVMESIAHARNKAGCFRCDIPLGRGL